MNKLKHISSLSRIFLDYKKKKTVLNSLPIRLWIETSSLCNLKCVMCLNRAIPASEKGLMDFGLFKKIIDEVKSYVYDVYLHHRGESLIHPEFPQMIDYARRGGLRVKFHTNGTLMTPELAQKILEAGPDLVSFSVDGFTKEVYEKIRVGASFVGTVNNISYFLKLKRDKGFKKPYTIIEQIEFPEVSASIYEDRKKFTKYFKKLGLDEIIFKKLYNWAGYLGEPGGERTYTMCTFLWYSSAIFWDGTVSPCPQDYYGKLKLGNVKENSLRDIWNGEDYVSLRKQMLRDVEGLIPCNKCDRLYRKKIAGIPFQYFISYLNDNIIGYGRLRKMFGSYERNE